MFTLNIFMNKLFDFLNTFLTRLLPPESKLKDTLASLYYRYKNPFYDLANSNVIKSLQMLPDGTLLCELYDYSKFISPPDKVISRRIKYGKASRLGEIKDFPYFGSFFMMLNEIYALKIYEKFYKLKEGGVVVDAGANIGLFTIKAGRVVGDKGKVIAIEPDPNILGFLKRNVELNSLRNVVVVSKGIYSHKGKLRFNVAAEIGEGSLYEEQLPGMYKPTGFVEVEVDTLDNILKELEISKVDFVKMDIEGAEIEALKGMDGVLKGRPKLAIAAYHVVNGKETFKTIIPWLEKRGFVTRKVGEIVYSYKI
jgi:FkbM family methyltransferase